MLRALAILSGLAAAASAAAAEAGRHPNADYFHYALVTGSDPELCRSLGDRFNGDLVRVGEVDGQDKTRYLVFEDQGPTERSAWQKIPQFGGARYYYVDQSVGGVTSGVSFDRKLAHYKFDPARPFGPDNGVPEDLLPAQALGKWVESIDADGKLKAPKNYATYQAINLFFLGERLFVIADGRRGFGSGAKPGEHSFSGVYELFADNHLERRCLYETYTEPPADLRLEASPAVRTFYDTLRRIYASPPEIGRIWPIMNEFIEATDYDASVFPRRLPLEQQFDDTVNPRRKYDDNLAFLARWSAEGVAQKRLFRAFLAQLPDALSAAQKFYVERHHLPANEARRLAELALMSHIDFKVGRFTGSAKPPADEVKPADYKPRYDFTPKEADLLPAPSDLRSAVRAGVSAAKLKEYLAFTPDHGDSGPESVLMAALDRPDLMRVLLDAEADPNYRNPFGKTPLMMAAALDLPDSVTLLLQRGAKTDIRTKALPADPEKRRDYQAYNVTIGGRTALMYAAENARAQTIKLLLANGANAKERDDKDRDLADYLGRNTVLKPTEREDLARKLAAR